jgi:hypothetical protein
MAETSAEAGTQPRAASPDSDAEFIAALLALGPVECPNCGKELPAACVEASEGREGREGREGSGGGAAVPRCPACSSELTVRPGLEDPQLGGWLAGVVGLALATGFTTMLMGYFVLMTMFARRGAPPFRQVLLAIVLPALVCGGLLAVFMRLRPRVRALPPAARYVVAGLCWLAGPGAVVWFLTMIR